MFGLSRIRLEKTFDSIQRITGFPHKLVELHQANWSTYKNEIMRIEMESYEPARRESPEYLARAVYDPRGVAFIASYNERVVGFCFGGPLEWFEHVEGVRHDPEWQKHNTLYSFDVTVAFHFRRHGVARLLKLKQIETSQHKGYRHISGRNRLVRSADMISLNIGLGAKPLKYLHGTYKDGLEPDSSLYYQIDI